MFGNTEIVVAENSFWLVELDLDELKKPCTVCSHVLTCSHRTYRGIANSTYVHFCQFRVVNLGLYAIKDALKLKNWKFHKNNAIVSIYNPDVKTR